MWGCPHPIYPTSANRISRKFTSSIMHTPTTMPQALRRARRDGLGGACDDHQGDDLHVHGHDHHERATVAAYTGSRHATTCDILNMHSSL
jgi:hypothetical protein